MRSGPWLAVLLGCALLAPAARADAPAHETDADPDEPLGARGLRADEIARLAAQLGVAAQRRAAVAALTSLHAESLPGIAARLSALRPKRPDPEQAKAAFTAFRHALGSRRGDDAVDL